MSNPNLKYNTYNVDADNPHIILKENPDPDLFLIIQRECPANLYLRDSHGYHYDYAGCLECGTCLAIGGKEVFAAWDYPRGSYGVDYSE